MAIALPTSFKVAEVRAGYRSSSSLAMSPYNFTQQVFSWAGRQKVAEISVPIISAADANEWTQFFDSLDGFTNTFNMDLSDFFPHETGITSVPMRLSNPEAVWGLQPPLVYTFSFSAMEAL